MYCIRCNHWLKESDLQWFQKSAYNCNYFSMGKSWYSGTKAFYHCSVREMCHDRRFKDQAQHLRHVHDGASSVAFLICLDRRNCKICANYLRKYWLWIEQRFSDPNDFDSLLRFSDPNYVFPTQFFHPLIGKTDYANHKIQLYRQ